MSRKVQTLKERKIKPSWGITVEKEVVAMSETGDVKITQYLRPNGKTTMLIATIDKEHADKAADFIFSCEFVPPQNVMIYGRKQSQSAEEELTELGFNGPGDNSPNKALCRLIDRLCAA